MDPDLCRFNGCLQIRRQSGKRFDGDDGNKTSAKRRHAKNANDVYSARRWFCPPARRATGQQWRDVANSLRRKIRSQKNRLRRLFRPGRSGACDARNRDSRTAGSAEASITFGPRRSQPVSALQATEAVLSGRHFRFNTSPGWRTVLDIWPLLCFRFNG